MNIKSKNSISINASLSYFDLSPLHIKHKLKLLVIK